MKEIVIRSELKKVFYLITNKKFEVARVLLENYKKNPDYNSFEFELNCLTNYLNEKREFYGEKSAKIIEFSESGSQSYYYGNIDEASDIFKAGKYVTDCIAFDYLTGKVLYTDPYTREEGVEYIEKYINEGGGIFLQEAYSTLVNFYAYLDEELSNSCMEKAERISSISMSNDNVIKKNIYVNNE